MSVGRDGRPDFFWNIRRLVHADLLCRRERVSHQTQRQVTIDVWVVPGASRSEFMGLHGDNVKLRVTAHPEGGRANDEAIRLLEGCWGPQKSDQGNYQPSQGVSGGP